MKCNRRLFNFNEDVSNKKKLTIQKKTKAPPCKNKKSVCQ